MAEKRRILKLVGPCRVMAALTLVVCAGCVTAQPLSVAALREAVEERSAQAPYEHDLAADLAWIQALPLLTRLADDIVSLNARFLAVGGERWSVPGVPPHLYCLIGPAGMRPIPISDPPVSDIERALSVEVERFIAPYNRLLAQYYEAEFGWECSEDDAGQSMP